MSRYGLQVGDDPNPIEQDWWVTAADVRAYAAWLDRRASELERVMLDAMRGPQLHAASTFSAEFIPWLARWRAFKRQLDASWWQYVPETSGIGFYAVRDDLNRVRAWHGELGYLGERARALGLAAPPIAPVPTDKAQLEQLSQAVEQVREAAAPAWLVWGAAAAAAAAAVLVLRKG